MDTIAKNRQLNNDGIFDLMKQFITEVIGEEFVEEMDITPKSSLLKILKWIV